MNQKTLFPSNPPEYFYRVTQLVSFRNETFPIHAGSFYRDFFGEDLAECRSKAYQYGVDMMEELEHCGRFLLDNGSSIYHLGKEATVSVAISLIEYFNEEDYNSYTLNSEDIHVRKQSMEMEYKVLSTFYRDSTAA